MADASLMPIRERVSFGKIPASISLPNLIEVQKKSYKRFLQMHLPHSEREEVGLQEVFRTIFPISDFRETADRVTDGGVSGGIVIVIGELTGGL